MFFFQSPISRFLTHFPFHHSFPDSCKWGNCRILFWLIVVAPITLLIGCKRVVSVGWLAGYRVQSTDNNSHAIFSPTISPKLQQLFFYSTILYVRTTICRIRFFHYIHNRKNYQHNPDNKLCK